MIGSLNSIEATAEKLSIPQLQQAMRDGTLPPYVGIPLLQKKVQDQKRMQAAAQMNPQAANQPPVAQRIMQEAQGVDTLHSNLPEEYADGGIIAFAGGTYGKTIAEQLDELYGKQRAAEYGWSPEAAAEYKSAYKPEMRSSMSRRNLAPANQPMSLEELQQAQARARAQTGLGIRNPETIEIPPYREPVNIPEVEPATGMRPSVGRGGFGAPPYSVTPEYIPAENLGVSGLLPKEGRVFEGAAFEHPSATPRADAAYAQAEYAERAANRGYRPRSKEAADLVKDEAAQNAKWAQAKQIAEEGHVGPMRAGAIAPTALDTQTIGEFTKQFLNQPESAYKHPELKQKVQNALGGPSDLEVRPWLKNLFASEEAAPQTQTPAATQPASAPTSKPAAGPIPYENLPQGARDMQARILEKQINDKYHFDPYAEEPTQAPAPVVAAAPTQEASAQGIKSLADYQNEWRNLAGENKGIAEIRAELAKSKEETAKDKERAPWMALMQAGLATMAGTSPYALANIGAGGAKGLASYVEAQKDLRREQDKYLDMQAKLGQAQREEDLAALKYGTDSVKFDKAEANKERLQDKYLTAQKDIHAATNEANKEIAKTRVKDQTESLAFHNRRQNLEALNSYLKRKENIRHWDPKNNSEHADIQRNIDMFSRLVHEAGVASGGAGAAGGSKILDYNDLVREIDSAQ